MTERMCAALAGLCLVFGIIVAIDETRGGALSKRVETVLRQW